MGIITDAAANRAAQAVIDAGKHWEDFKSAVQRIQDTQLTPRTVIALISDECDLTMTEVQAVFTAIQKFPDSKFCSVAA